MNSEKPFKLGVVEGFFGLAWSWEARIAYAEFLAQHGFNSYLYAPKSDAYLRKQWQQAFPIEHFEKLSALAAHYSEKKVEFGIGLSPFELYLDFNSQRRSQLKNKLEEINQIKPDTLCILFDDMHGELPKLAQKQAEILNFVAEHSQANNLIMCPTYYSDDPMLAKHFGKKPENYLEDLGSLIDKEVDIFWTGPKVFSKELPVEHLKTLSDKLQRKPLIWDNYPVNDSQALTNFLHLQPFEHKAQELKKVISGHMANPMNQAFLSQLALYTLAEIYKNTNTEMNNLFALACESLCPGTLHKLIINDADLFQEVGLKNMDTKTKEKLILKYSPYRDSPLAKEILDWLNNKYVFDPACLT